MRIRSINLKHAIGLGATLGYIILASLAIMLAYQDHYQNLQRVGTSIFQYTLESTVKHLSLSQIKVNPKLIEIPNQFERHKNTASQALYQYFVISEADIKQHQSTKTMFNVLLDAFTSTPNNGTTLIQFDEKHEMLLGISVFQDETQQRYLVLASFNLSPELSLLTQQSIQKGLKVSAVLGLLLLFLLWLVRHFIHRPIQQLIAAGDALSHHHYAKRIDTVGQGEFKALCEQFNRMANSIDNKVTQLQNTELALRERQAVLDGVFATLPDVFLLVDQQGNIIEQHCRTLDAHLLSLYKGNIFGILPSPIRNHVKKSITSNGRHTNPFIQTEFSLPNQSKSFFELRACALPNNAHWAIVIRDITDKKQQEEVILHHAFYDALTGLPNRFLVMERLTQLVTEADRQNGFVCVFFIDLDDFKKVNDSMGHEVGDQLLKAAADRLKSALRAQDTVARLGGDEFIILLGGVRDESDIAPIANNLVQLFHKPLLIEKTAFNISISLGIAIYPFDAKTPMELLSRADSAMYNSKHLGRNTYSFFTESMSQALSRRIVLEEKLRNALRNNELEVFYQPQFEVETLDVIGAEALLRWKNPELGNIPPSEFIPLAEQTGLIIEIGQFVLKTAIAQTYQIQQAGFDNFRIAVNLSPRQFKDPELVNKIKSLLSNSQVSPHQIELEITEGVLLSGKSEVKNALHEIHQLGLLISMDDFGTGYSSLNYLRQYPFDVLKIDQSFVSDMTDDAQGHVLVKSIISLAHGIGLKVVAEGVETHTQLKLLKQFRCDLGQGYLIGKPMSASTLLHWLNNENIQSHSG